MVSGWPLEVGWLSTLSGRSYFLAARDLAAGRPQGAGSGECYESHSPNKFLIVLYGDSIVNGISCHHRGYTMSDLARAGP